MTYAPLDVALLVNPRRRAYTLERLDGLDDDEWYLMPGGVTHIAWQVGHLAIAQYRLCLDRIRGERPEDERLISADFLRRVGARFSPERRACESSVGRGTGWGVFERVHEAPLRERAVDRSRSGRQRAPTKPHRSVHTKLDSLLGKVRGTNGARRTDRALRRVARPEAAMVAVKLGNRSGGAEPHP